jgi:hypothetical protein
MKCEATQPFVVGGFTDPQRSRAGFGALLVGYYDGDDFVFAGKVGTGFDTHLLVTLRERLDALEIGGPPSRRPSDCRGCGRIGRVRRSSWTSRSRVDGPRQAAPLTPACRFSPVIHRAMSSGADVTISHPEKMLFPVDGITKGEMAEYYRASDRSWCRTSHGGRSPWSASTAASARRASIRRA